MENTRNSASYTARAVNSAIPKMTDTYHPKSISSRRPVEAQAAEPPLTAAMSSNIPSNTARPVAAAPATNGPTRLSSHRRRQMQQMSPPTSGAFNESVPAAPDVPRAPPMSYKDPYASMAAAARAPPGPPVRSSSGRSRDPPIQVNPSRQQATIQSAADRLYHLRSPPYAPVEPLTGAVERRSSNSTRRPSVPDRSPLQKLEGKLDDISKEERRARILEAELAAQELAEAERRARRAREASERQQRVVSQPVTTSEKPVASAPNRATSTKRHVSMPVQHKSPEISDLESEDGVPYDISPPWDPSTDPPAVTQPPHRIPSQKVPRATPTYQRGPHAHAVVPRSGSLKGKEPVGVSRGTGSFRDRSAVSNTQNIHRKPMATGLGLVGVEDPSAGPEISRSDSKRVAQSNRDSRGIAAAQMEMQQQIIDGPGATRDLQPPSKPTNRKSVGFSEPDTDQQQSSMKDSHHHSIKGMFSHHDPDRTYIAPPALEEWKGAPIGALLAEDLDLDAPVRTSTGNKAWWEENQSARRRRSSGRAEPTYDGYADVQSTPTTFSPQLYLKCGPLLRYAGLRRDSSRAGQDREIWRGSVMIVTIDAQSSYSTPPTLRLFKQPMDLLPPPPLEVNGDQLDPSYVDPIEGQIKVSRTGKTMYVRPIDEIAENVDLSRVEDGTGLFAYSQSNSGGTASKSTRIHKKDGEKLGRLRDIPGVRLHAERGVTFWRFNIEIELGSSQARIAYKINHGPATGFWVPARGESMNIMFHSCNGFSATVDSTQFCGPDPMWRDVLNTHQTRPFHVMIGGGDQIYNDIVIKQTTLFRHWIESRNPIQKQQTPFSEEMQNELEQFYLDRYSMWFSQGLFGMANSQIPMVNIWDDHDIIDGYGSYTHHFMQTPVFMGIGNVAFKYYMLFQHQSVIAETEATEPSWVLGKSPGPYIKERSRSVFMNFGRHVAFLGLDCRTERQHDEILTEETYDVVFDRLEDEIIKGETKHLIVLLGVPIAYPRLNFLESVLTSRLMHPIKAIGRAGLLGNFVNKFDGSVEILDDLDDHWTAKHHKEERNWFVRELQHIASTKSVRITILGGDVHLAAIGQFFSNKKLNISKDKDHRYMPNVVSSAIVNTPPPDMMADIINKRNKVHHLDPFTDEDMIPIFTHDVDGKKRNNTHLLPHRNWCSIREYKPGTTPPSTPTPPPSEGDEDQRNVSGFTPGNLVRRLSGNQTRPSARNKSRGPPLSYYNNPAYAAADEEQTGAHNRPQSSFSPDRSEPEKPRSRRNSLTSLFRRRPSVDDAGHESSQSLPNPVYNSSARQEPPSNFHRRPSVMGKKGVQQQGDFINLEGGLDICLNLEVSQHDPAGITTPYRLLVPTLNYTATEPGATENQPRKSRSVFGVFSGPKRKTKVGDDGYSMSGSESGSELGEMSDEEEERSPPKYRFGPKIVIPGFGKRNKRNSAQATPEKRLSSGFHANDEPTTSPEHVDSGARNITPTPTQEPNRRQSVDVGSTSGHRNSAYETLVGKRHVSAPQYSSGQATVLPARSGSSRRQPTYNSSHKSQLPVAAPAPQPEPKVYRRSMGGILNQHSHDKKWEQDAHVLAHTSSQKRSKRDSYPPHPAIVGAGPGSPYTRSRQGLQAREDTAGGDYFGSGGRDGTAYPPAPTSRTTPGSATTTTPASAGAFDRKAIGNPEYDQKPVQRAEYAQRSGYDRTSYPSYPQRNGNAGVGAKYLGGGRYEDDEDEEDSADEDARSYSGRSYSGRGAPQEESQESFVVPKKKKKWQIWRKGD